MWKPEHRQAARRKGLRYDSDMTDEEWALAVPLIPPAKRGGRKRDINVREVMNGIFYVLWTGCQWKALPKDFPPKSTVHWYFMLRNWDGTLERIHHALYVAVRERARFRDGIRLATRETGVWSKPWASRILSLRTGSCAICIPPRPKPACAISLS
jgi:transposase